jgi:YD repeat-containing protein
LESAVPISYRSRLLLQVLPAGLLAVCSAYAVADASIYTEQGKLIRAPQAVGTMGADLFGDKVNFYSGALEFIQHDISIPGNSRLSVGISRRLVTGQERESDKHFGTWELEIPHIHGMFAFSAGWLGKNGTNQRCTSFGAPPIANGSSGSLSVWAPTEFWHGNLMYIPGIGDQEILARHPANTLTTAALVTRDMWKFECNTLASVSNFSRENGQGFTATSPDGIQYRFDWLARRAHTPITKPGPAPEALIGGGGSSSLISGPLSPSTGVAAPSAPVGPVAPPPSPDATGDPNFLRRDEYWIMPTQVTDRFGNWVRYTYDTVDKWKVTKIESNDGRVINIGYDGVTHQISSVNNSIDTWNYAYSAGDLSVVTRPDNSTWQLLGVQPLLAGIPVLVEPSCEESGTLTPIVWMGSMVHPSGATGRFSLTPTIHGRSYVQKWCSIDIQTGYEYAHYPRYFSVNSLTAKTITLPGQADLNWSYAFGPVNASWDTCSGCEQSKKTMVTDPDGVVTRFTFGNRHLVNEGQVQLVESGLPDGTGHAGGTPLRSVVTTYQPAGASNPYPDIVGSSDQTRGDGEFNTRLLPVSLKVTSQQDSVFNWNATVFENYARPKTVVKSSSLGFSLTETTVYDNNTTKWVLGQVATVTADGKVMVRNDYNPVTANLETVWRFGKKQQTISYNADGTVATRKDGLDHTTTLTNYKRGIAQNVGYADGSAASAVVDYRGLISTVTVAGFATNYRYDAMGRLNRVIYPTGGTTAWNDTTLTFEPVAASEYGLPAGHWRQTVATGNARTVNYYDGLWQPVLTRTFDAGNEAGTSKVVLRRFDHAGRMVFESYPQRDISGIGASVAGKSSVFEPLGRISEIRLNSELGILTTRFDYLSGFQRRITDPRNGVTTSTFFALDEPREDAVMSMAAPLGVTVAFARDIFGKTTAVTRSGAGKSAARSYVYNVNEQLCKTIEPETGATVQTYDLADSVSWRASGLSLPSTSSCDDTSVPAAKKVTFGYDGLNRLLSTTYGDGGAAITRTYTTDGLPLTVSSAGVVWTSGYDNRRNNISESMLYGGATYPVARQYDANGALRLLTYPDQSSVDYAPNALGEPTKAGVYASGVTYHPNGAMAGFSYGNGIAHTMTQNLRGLPEATRDVGVLYDIYTYDENANVKSISDGQEALSTRAMTYDALDRLTVTSSPALFGTVTNTYDTLDNITNVSVTQGPTARATTHTFDAATNRLTGIASSASAYNLGYGYDGQGNITTRGSRTYVFDQGNRMKSATGIASYVYDGLGHRTSTVSTDGVNRVSVYTQAGQLLYLRSTSVPLAAGTKYIYLGRHQVAEVKAAGAN